MRKKVLHILNTSSYSGAENVAITIINHTKSEVDSVYMSLEGSISEVLHENDIEFYPVEKLSVKSIRKAIKDIRPDIIHAHDFTAGILSTVATCRIPIINHLHNNSPWIKKLSPKSIVYGLSCFCYKKILTVSSSVMDEYILGRFFKRKSEVIGNPIDINAIVAKCSSTEQNDIPHSDIQFLGRLTPPKKPLFFLEIIAELKKNFPTLSVSMVGDGEMREEVELAIERLDLRETVTLYGFKKNPYPYLSRSKILCMPSAWEGFGLVAVEALVLGKPVVASPVGGLPGIVTDECGDLCQTKEEFVDVLLKYLENEAYCQRKSDGALHRAEQLNTINDYTIRLISVYNEI